MEHFDQLDVFDEYTRHEETVIFLWKSAVGNKIKK